MKIARSLVVAAGLALPMMMPMTAHAQLSAAKSFDHAAPLPSDPNLVTGELPSGVRYIVRRHAQPEGRATVWMHVDTGSLNETDKQRGIAHYLEHMAFNGSANFPPGTVIKFFEDLGLTFGRHQNASTGFDATNYQLFLGDNKPENLKKALTFMSDVAFRLLLDPKEIESERQIILEEKRSRQSPQARVQEIMLKRYAPGSILGERLPIGTEETILGVQQQDFKDYWGKWYAPTNVTVIVVADLDPQVAVEEITRQFGSEPKRPAPVDMETGINAYSSDSAAVASDPEITRASIGMMKIAPPRPPTTTVGGLREDLVETIGTWAFNRRLAKKLEQGKVSFINANAGVSTLFRAGTMTQVRLAAETSKWQSAWKDLAVELQRARLHGFSEQELSDARTVMLEQAKLMVKRESSLEAQILAGRYSGQVADREPIMSAAQNAELLAMLLPTITPVEVSKHFTEQFEPTNVLFTAELPSGEGKAVISESDLLAFGKSSLDVKPEKEAEAARIASLMDTLPTPGAASDVTFHDASGVTSAWLPSGAAVHHKFVDSQKDSVTITIALAAGAINETPATRGVSEFAAVAWGNPATSRFTSTQIREYLTGIMARVNGGAGDDVMSITVSGPPKDLESGLQVAHLMLTDPVIEKAEFERVKTQQLQAIEQRKTQPQGVIQEVIADSIFPKGELRRRPLTAAQVNAVSLEAAQAYLKNVIATSPIEVSVVGEIDKATAMALVEKYLGSLPARARISAATLDEKRVIAREPGPRNVSATVVTKTPMAVVLDGFFGPDAENIKDTRLMNLASRVLSSRMVQTIREEKQLVYSIGAQSNPAVPYPGFGMFMAAAPTKLEKAADLGAVISAMYDEFASTGPTSEEVAKAVKQIHNTMDEEIKKPAFWTAQTQHMVYRGRTMDDVMAARAAYAAFTSAEVKECFNRYYKPESKVRFTVTPAATPSEGEMK